MKTIFFISMILLGVKTRAQLNDSLAFPNTCLSTRYTKPEMLTSGYLDISNNGQMNASARIIKLLIGELKRFTFPMSVYSGVTANSFYNPGLTGSEFSNQQLLNGFINPISGLLNLSFEGLHIFNPDSISVTKYGMIHQSGARILTGYRSGNFVSSFNISPINFLNLFLTAGLYFQTGAWEIKNRSDPGIFWIAGRYLICKSGIRDIQSLFPNSYSNGFYHGWSVAWGLDISKMIDLKLIYSNYLKPPELEYVQPIYQFSFQYSMR